MFGCPPVYHLSLCPNWVTLVKGVRLGFTSSSRARSALRADLDARHRAVLSFDAHERGFFTAGVR